MEYESLFGDFGLIEVQPLPRLEIELPEDNAKKVIADKSTKLLISLK